eukprot:scaffold49701_cov33-Tisochrysis_lutea.AAC.6
MSDGLPARTLALLLLAVHAAAGARVAGALNRRALLSHTAAAALLPALRADAWCGEAVPSWAFYLKWDDEPAFPFEYEGTRGSFYCRVVGDIAREKKVTRPHTQPPRAPPYSERRATLSLPTP